MGLRINTNVAALSAIRQLGKSQHREEHAIAALSSGNRIVHAGDDAAGLAISENLRGQVKGLESARNNAENAISMLQVAEGALNEQNNILIRLRELAIQASSDTVSDDERGYLDKEYQSLTSEFDRISKVTKYGRKQLLDGSGGDVVFHVGPNGGDENRIRYTLNSDSSASNIGIDGLAVRDRDDARDNLEKIDKALGGISAIRANFGAIQSRLQSTSYNLSTYHENLSEAHSRIADADVAFETGELTQARVQQSFGIAVLAQANSSPDRVIKLLTG